MDRLITRTRTHSTSIGSAIGSSSTRRGAALNPISFRAESIFKRWRTIAALVVASLAAVVALTTASSAQAITCIANTAWTSTVASSSTNFAIAQNSQCQDLNAAYTYTYNDYVRGWYRTSGGTWHAGSRGFVYVDTSDNGWIVLLTSVINGTVVRGQGLNRSQYVRYVT
jgi:hypothetical protein